MADNFVANPGSGGDTFAADDVAGVKYPYSKIDIGADGVSSPVTAINPLPVFTNDRTASGTLTTVGTTVDFNCEGYSTASLVLSGTQTNARTYEVYVSQEGTYWAFVNIFDSLGFPYSTIKDVSSDDNLTQVAGFTIPHILGVTGFQFVRVIRAAGGADNSAVTVSIRLNSQAGSVVTLSGVAKVEANGNFPVTGPLTDTELRATDVPVKVSSFKYPISTGNSSTTQLAAGASFTGAIETAQDQPSMSILMTSDQPMTVTIRQFIDIAGTFAAPDIVLYVPAGQGLARSLTINGNYLRVIARNNGVATTTTFNLNVAYGVLNDADGTGVMPVVELPLILIGQATQTAVVNNILNPTAGATALGVSGYRAASIQVVGFGTTVTGGTFIFEQSNDGVNWAALPLFNAALVTAVPITAAITATLSSIVYTVPIRCNFLRLRIATTITGTGTFGIQAFSRLSTEPWTPTATLVASNSAANNLTQVSGSVTATGVAGAAAQGATASGNPVLGGAVAKTAQPTARTDGQIVTPLYSKVGHQIVMIGQVRDLNDTIAPITLSTTAETTLVAAVAAVFTDIYSITIANTSATGVRVDFRTVAAGAIVESVWIPATTTLQLNPYVPYKQATVNTAWTAQLSAAVTDVRISARVVRNI